MDERSATDLYFFEVISMEAWVSLATALFLVMSVEMRFVSSKPSINSTSSVMSPSAFARRSKISSSSSPILILKPVCCLTRTSLISDRSARSFPSTSTFN